MTEFKQSLNKVKSSYKELAKAVGGFTKEQSNQILNICVRNTLINCGASDHDVEVMKMFSYKNIKEK